MAHTDKPLKATCAGPLTFGSRIHPGTEYKGTVDIAERFCEVINEELKGLVAAGAEFIQIDEPARGNVSGEEMARLFNKATEGVNAKLAFHICFGNRFGRGRFERVYANYFPGALRGQRRTSSCWSSPAASCRRSRRSASGSRDGRELGAGLIDVKNFYTDTPEDVAKRIHTDAEAHQAGEALGQPGLWLRLEPALHVQPEDRGAGGRREAGPGAAQPVGSDARIGDLSVTGRGSG